MFTVLSQLSGAQTFDWYAWVILPVVIFLARVCDVTLGTIRIIFISRGLRKIAPLLGFFEVLIWIVVIGQLVQHLESPMGYIGYAGGFAAGNFFGMWLENRLALGTFLITVMVSKNRDDLVEKIHNEGFGITCVDAQGSMGPVKIFYTVAKRKDVNRLLTMIHSITPDAFVTTEEVRSYEKGIFPSSMPPQTHIFFGRKSK